MSVAEDGNQWSRLTNALDRFWGTERIAKDWRYVENLDHTFHSFSTLLGSVALARKLDWLQELALHREHMSRARWLFQGAGASKT